MTEKGRLQKEIRSVTFNLRQKEKGLSKARYQVQGYSQETHDSPQKDELLWQETALPRVCHSECAQINVQMKV